MSKLNSIDALALVRSSPALSLFHFFWEGQGFKLKSPVTPKINCHGDTSVRLVWRNRKADASTTIIQSVKFKD
jgi:hypothetical protein